MENENLSDELPVTKSGRENTFKFRMDKTPVTL